jgi:regulator of PEP synthase PpsR (kinase-PPPase family)
VSPDRLISIRRNRLLNLNEHRESTYVETDAVREEIVKARRMFERHHWPVIDVTRRSIEETAAGVVNLLTEARAQRAAGVSARPPEAPAPGTPAPETAA